MAKSKAYSHIICDMSGSMADCQDETLRAINQYVADLAADKNLSAHVSLTVFNSFVLDTRRMRMKAKDWPALTNEDFTPAGMTPLLDAVGETVTKITDAEHRKGERVSVVIMTDGLENFSRTWRAPRLRRLLQGVQDERDWLVVFLGANQDAWAEGARLGTYAGTTMDYDTAYGMSSLEAVARATMAHSHGASSQSISFTDDERARAKGKPHQ